MYVLSYLQNKFIFTELYDVKILLNHSLQRIFWPSKAHIPLETGFALGFVEIRIGSVEDPPRGGLRFGGI